VGHKLVATKKRLSYPRGTARRTMSVDVLSSNGEQLYEKSHLKILGVAE